jgi:hypothetical protein
MLAARPIPEFKKSADHRVSASGWPAQKLLLPPKCHVLKKILEDPRVYSTLFFHQEKSFHDHQCGGGPFCG